MRIAFFVDKFPSLSETFILDQITGLLDRGHDVHIYGRKPSELTVEHEEVNRYRLIERTRYLPDLPRTKPARLLKAVKLLTRTSGPNHSKYLKTLQFWEYGRIALNLRLWYAISIFKGKSMSYDIIHSHFGPRGAMAVALRELSVIDGPVITTFHGADMSRYLQNSGQEYSLLAQKGDLFLPISNRWENKLIEIGFPEDRTHVHHMGVDTDTFEFDPPDIEKRPIRILSVARLTEKKGIEYGIRAFARCWKALKTDAEYVIVGEGARRTRLERLVRDLGLTESVHFAGWRSKDEVLGFLRQTHLFLAPSVTAESGDQEGIPVAIMEAMACGVPVVSTSHSGIPELVRHEESGLLVPERDVEALADALYSLIQHPHRLLDMAKAGREIVKTDFDIDSLNDRLVQHYRQAHLKYDYSSTA